MPAAIGIWADQFRTRHSITAHWASGLLAAALVIGLASPLKAIATKHIAAALETRIPRIALHPKVPISGMIVLGGIDTRVHAALKLAKKFPKAAIILSGPGPKMVAAAKEHLSKDSNLIVDHRAKNTYENAIYSGELTKSQEGECWLLITSAIHMPRALGAFHAAAVPVAPWPVLDTPHSLEEQSNWVEHELKGLIGYWMVGRTREIYPVDRPTASCSPKKVKRAPHTPSRSQPTTARDAGTSPRTEPRRTQRRRSPRHRMVSGERQIDLRKIGADNPPYRASSTA